jgi:hypothetical protein
MHVFPTSLELNPGTQYFVYENAILGAFSGGNTISGGQGYFATAVGSNFVPDPNSENFSLSGTVVTAVVPEPSALVVLLTGLLGFGLLRRYRKNAD